MLQLLRRHQCVTSADGSLDSRRIPEILKRFVDDREFWAFVEVTDEVLRDAEKLVAAHTLHTLDAIHVASVELFADRLSMSELTFVSAETRQTAVAAAVLARLTWRWA